MVRMSKFAKLCIHAHFMEPIIVDSNLTGDQQCMQ